MNRLERSWYHPDLITIPLKPFSYLFERLVRLRRTLYRKGIFSSKKLSVPVIVVGNITVGGTGKTPLVIYLAQLLKQQGLQPGIVSRGYRSKAKVYPYQVQPNDDADTVGDEALLMAQNSDCPVAIAPKRTAAAEMLIQQGCNIILSDDGLQHYALQRDIEIAVVDGKRRFGNGLSLPAGPLRESVNRLKQVDFIISNGALSQGEITMKLYAGDFVNLQQPNLVKPAEYFHDKPCHAYAGIGDPQRFFSLLQQLGLKATETAMPDHYRYRAPDFHDAKNIEIIMTEKDAVKCRNFADERFWYLPVKAVLPESFDRAFTEKLAQYF